MNGQKLLSGQRKPVVVIPIKSVQTESVITSQHTVKGTSAPSSPRDETTEDPQQTADDLETTSLERDISGFVFLFLLNPKVRKNLECGFFSISLVI